MSKNRYSKNGLIALCSIVYFTSYFARKDFAAVTVGILNSGAIDKTVAGLIGTAMFVMYGIGQLISGYLGDRVKPKTLILIGLGTTSLCNLIMPFVGQQYLMIPVWALNGLAQAMLWPPIVRILSQYLPHETYVKASLMVTSAAHIATILLYLYVPVCLTYMSWKAVFISAAALAAVMFGLFIVGLSLCLPKNAENIAMIAPVNAKKDEKGTSDAPAQSFFSLLMQAGILPIFCAIVAMGFLRDGIESWLPTLYAEAFQRDPSESTLISVALPIFAIISIILITILHKRPLKNEVFGSAVMFTVGAVICIPLLILITSTSAVGRVTCLVLAALVCGAMHGCNFLLISCLPGRFASVGRAAGASGFCNACVYVGAAISTYGIALISELLDWRGAIVSWLIMCIVGLVMCLLAIKRYTAFYKSSK